MKDTPQKIAERSELFLLPNGAPIVIDSTEPTSAVGLFIIVAMVAVALYGLSMWTIAQMVAP
jgi:hypothetical protein